MNMTWAVGASPGRCLMRLRTLGVWLTLVALINQAAARPAQGPHADLVGPPEPTQGVEPLGACCILGVCHELTNSDCTANGGEFQGAGTICDNQPCSGACCLPDKSGCQVMSLATCKSIGGFFYGGGTVCAGFECPGACCGDFGCYTTTPYDCSINGDTFIGGLCENAACVIPTGACCRDEGVCIDGLDSGNCAEFGGAYAGDNTTCAANPCADAGACCYDFSGFIFCQDPSFENDCTLFGGTFRGPGSTCDANACGTEPVGACCLAGSGCKETTEADCALVTGLYKGDHTACIPRICCPADFNNDGAVNTPDLTYFLARFGNTFLPPGSEPADLNSDGVVNTLDLTRFLALFSRACPT